jgi:hypothetical protein
MIHKSVTGHLEVKKYQFTTNNQRENTFQIQKAKINKLETKKCAVQRSAVWPQQITGTKTPFPGSP